MIKYKTLHNICYRQIIILSMIGFLYGKESYSIMYPSYNINMINKFEVDSFYDQIESTGPIIIGYG